MTSRSPGAGFWRVEARYGLLERPDERWVVNRCCEHGMIARSEDTTFYLGRAYWLPDGPAPMWRWRKRLFAFMSCNAGSASNFFGVHPDRVVELGARIEF